MTHYALIGHPLGHSLSPQIHRALLAAAHLEGDYRLLDIAPEDLANRLPELQTLRGFNVTIPHKQAVLSAMAELDEKAALFGAVNTVAVRGGKFYGYNTDCYGFLRSLSAAGIPLAGRVLVLGTGGVARMFAFEAVLAGAAVTLAARTPSKGCALAAEIAEKCGRAVTVTDFNSVTGDWDLIVNGTPVGMFPKVDACPLEPGVLAHTAAVFDAIYNPMETRLLRLARQNGAKVVNGLPMLVWQAAVAHPCPGAAGDRANGGTAVMNIVLCGFMGSGKTVVGKELAKIMGRRFVDTDQLVEARSGVSIPAIFQVHGEDYFRELERAACAEAAEIPNCVISTGGGALTFDENVRTLRTTGKIVLLDASFDVICQRVGNGANRPLFRDPVQAKALYDARQAKYRAAADYAVDGDASARKTALTIADLFR